VESPADLEEQAVWRPCEAVESPADLEEQAVWRPCEAVESSELREEQALTGVIKVELHLGKTVKKKKTTKKQQSEIKEIIPQKANKVMNITANCDFLFEFCWSVRIGIS
jgi:hypothetical protein